MIITKLHLKNFKRFKDEVKIDLEVENKYQNIVLIEALNGVGKTSILQAIQGAFFGLENSEFQKFLNYESRDIDGVEMLIALEYYDNDFNPCLIRRVYKHSGNETPPQSKLYFSVSGIPYEMNDESWEEYLNKNFPREISNFFFFDGERLQYLIDPKDPKKIKGAIEKILGIEAIRNLRNSLIDLKSNALREIESSGVDKKIQLKKIQLSDQEKMKNDFLLKISELNSLYDDLGIKRKNSDGKLSLLAKNGLTKEKISERESLIKGISEKENDISRIEDELDEFRVNYIDKFLLSQYAPLLNEKIESGAGLSNREFLGLNTNEVINDVIAALYEPVCIVGGEMLSKEKRNHVAEILRQILDTEKFTTDLDASGGALLTANEKGLLYGFLHQIKKGNEYKISDLIDQKNALLNVRDAMRTKKEELENEMDTTGTDDVEELHHESIRLSQEMSGIEIQIKSLEESVNRANGEIKRLQKDIEDGMSLSSELESKKKYLDILSRLNTIFETHIDSLAIDTKKRLEEKTFEMFSHLINANIYSRVEITDNYEVRLIDNLGVHQDGLNSGHIQILMTSMLWGLEQLSDFKLPVIIDTPLARLDPIHRKNMLEKYFSIAGGQVIVLSQPSEIADSDKRNEKFISHLKGGQYVRLSFDDRDLQTSVEYVKL